MKTYDKQEKFMKTCDTIENKPSVHDKDSKKKYRDTILKVFQARVNSPNNCGAILVKSPEVDFRKSFKKVSEVVPASKNDVAALSIEKIKTTEKNKRHKVSTKNKTLLEQCKCINSETAGSTSNSSSESCSMGSSDHNRPRKKKRKTRSERNKSKATHMTKKSSSKEKTTAVAKHVSNTQHLTDSVNASVSEGDTAFSKITNSRLTKRLGLFNQGKKSKKIERDPIVVSSSVQKKTDADLWKIIHDDEDGNNRMEVDTISQSPQSNSLVLTIPNLKSISGKSRSSVEQMKPQLVYKTPLSSHHSVHSVKYISSVASSSCHSVSSEECLPSSPPLPEISTYVMKGLMNKPFIPKDLLQKTCDELQKLMKQSVPVSATPISVKLAATASQNHGSIQRSLLNSFMTARIESSNENSTKKRDQFTDKKKADLIGDGISYNGKKTESNIDTDVQMLSQSQSPTVSKETILVNAKSLLQYNDLMAVNRHTVTEPVNAVDGGIAMEVSSTSQENRLSKHLMSASQSSGLNSALNNSFLNQVNDGQNNRSFPLNHIQNHRQFSALDSASRPPLRSTSAVVTELQPHYMPQFHDGFYKDRLAIEESVWPNSYIGTNTNSALRHQAGALDILDLLDVEPSHPSSTFASFLCDTGMNEAPWLVPSLPQQHSPSPPHLFPHRLY